MHERHENLRNNAVRHLSCYGVLIIAASPLNIGRVMPLGDRGW